MRSLIAIGLAPMLSISLLMLAVAVESAEVETTGSAEAGRALFGSVGCYACHGWAGQGSIAGPSLAPKLLPLSAFAAIVRQPPNEMPPYPQSVLSDRDVAHIYEYLKTIPSARSAKHISLLNMSERKVRKDSAERPDAASEENL